MTTRQMIENELQQVPDERLDDLYGIVKQFVARESSATGILAKLQAIEIEAPTDFAANFDLYISGEKRVDDLP